MGITVAGRLWGWAAGGRRGWGAQGADHGAARRLLVALGLTATGVLAPAWAGDAGDTGEGGGLGGLVGTTAPRFVLPRVGSDVQVASDTLFEAYGATLLAFWTTHCAECSRRMEVCQQLYDWGESDGLNVVGVNFDDQPSAKMALVARSAGPRLLHLYDPGGRMAAVYGAGPHSYSAFLVDERGVIRAAYYEIMPDELLALKPAINDLLQEALGGGAPAGQTGAAAAAGATTGQGASRGSLDHAAATHRPGVLEELGILKEQKLELHGRGLMRYMHIDTTGAGAVGANGEPLVPGPSLRSRAELELTYAITPQLKAGGFLRLSNEGDRVLRSGPDYLSTPWGSFILRYDTRGHLPVVKRFESSLLAGYYRVFMTPFTLMRWDKDDTPVAGGQRAQGCGVCGGAAGMAGFIRSESLEQVEPEVSFEGARWNLTLMDRFDLLLVYARPQAPHPEDSGECYTSDPEQNYYHQDLYSGRLKVNLALPWGPDPLEIAATGLLVSDSKDLPGCPTAYMHDHIAPSSDRVLSTDVKLPLPGLTSLYGEVASSHWDPDRYCESDCRLVDGLALRGGLITEWRGSKEGRLLGLPTAALTTRAEFAYHRIEEDFFSAFSALTYESNLQGPRVSLRADWGPVGAGMFYKRGVPVVKVDPPEFAGSRDQVKQTSSAWVDVKPWSGGVFEVGGVRSQRDLWIAGAQTGHLGPETQNTLILSLTQQIAPRCTLFGELELVDGEYQVGESTGGLHEVTSDYTSTVFRVMADIRF